MGLYVRSVRGRLAFLFLALFGTVVLLGLASLWGLSHSNEVSTDVRERWLPDIRLLGDLNNFTSDYRTAEANTLLAASRGELATSLQQIGLLNQAIIRAQHDYEQIPHGTEEAALYRQFSAAWDAYKVIATEVTALSASGHSAEGATIYLGRSRTTYDAASDDLGQLTNYNVALAASASERSAAAYKQATWLMGGALLLSGLMLCVVIAQVRRQVSFPLLDLSRAMRLLAANDTNVDIGHTDRVDEIGEMARAVVVFRANAIELIHSQHGLAQQALMLEEKLLHEQSVTQMQRNFVTMITHEFRTPLTQIDAQAQRLANLRDRLLPEQIGNRAGRIRAAVVRLVRLIDHLVETTRLMDDDPRLFFHPEAIDLTAVLRDVCKVQREVSPEAQILEYIGSEPIPMSGDPKLLFQAFGNLISNAVKYSLGCARVVVHSGTDNNEIVVTVEDSGIGIPEADLEHVFSRYYRGGNVSGFVGTGIGLFLVATVLRLHGGRIVAESKVDSGSCFTARLPMARRVGSVE